ncbi:MAG: hypothetical protein OSJ70_01945 [Bacilli bacterium]|nr:hypothetical protein [Bacilli bacterium]
MYNYKGFTCTKDVLLYLDVCREEQEQVFKKLDALEIKFFDPNKRELKIEKKKLKQQLTIIRARIQKCLKILEDGVVFEKRDLLKFLPKYLSLKEKELYVLMPNVTEDDFLMNLITKTYFLNVFSTKYNIVTTVHNKNKLENQGQSGLCGGETDDIKDYLSICENEKYICLSDAPQYSLLNGTELNELFSGYPYIRDLAFDLIDLKLENPFMSDEERLNIILRDLQKKKRLPNN